MKKLCLSLATVVALSSSNLVADSLVEALKSGKVSGKAMFLYQGGNHFDVSAAGALHSDANNASAALAVSYKTGSFYGFKIGATAQTGYDLEKHGKDGSTEDDNRNTVQATDLHEIYLEYHISKSNVKVGRQEINGVPLMMVSSVFPMRESFDAITANIYDISNTELKLIYVDRWNKRYAYDSNGKAGENDVDFDGGVWTIYAKNNSYKPLTIDGQFMSVNGAEAKDDGNIVQGNTDMPFPQTDDYTQYFLRTDYKLPISHPLSFGLLYAGASFDTPTNEAQGAEDKAHMYGAKISSKFEKLGVAIAYTSVTDDNNFPGTLSHIPDALAYTNNLLHTPFQAGADAYSLELSYPVMKNLNAKFKYTHVDQDTSDKVKAISGGNFVGEANEFNMDVTYKLDSILKGLSTRGLFSIATHGDKDYAKINEAGARGSRATFGRIYVTYIF